MTERDDLVDPQFIATLRRANALAIRIRDANEFGGLHIAVSDGNLEDEHIEFCLEQTDKPLTEEERQLANDLMDEVDCVRYTAFMLQYLADWTGDMDRLIRAATKGD